MIRSEIVASKNPEKRAHVEQHRSDSVAVGLERSVAYQSVVPVRRVVPADSIVLNLQVLSCAQSEASHVL